MPPADGTTPAPQSAFMALAEQIVLGQAPPHARRQAQSVRTLFTTEHAFDAGVAGFDGPCEPGTDGGFSVTFDGRWSQPSVVMNGSDGQIEVVGFQAIRELRKALEAAEKLAERMTS